MRNCFVPQCDAFSKRNNLTKRMMFTAPKDEAIYQSWKRVLFNKREYRPTDKVCERHFNKEDILTHWDHFIHGQVFQLKRDKPKIKPNAIPSLNLPENITIANANFENITSDSHGKTPVSLKPPQTRNSESKKRLKQDAFIMPKNETSPSPKRQKLAEPAVTEKTRSQTKNKTVDEEAKDQIQAKKSDDHVINVADEKIFEVSIITLNDTDTSIRLDDIDAKRKIFDGIYDDIYEVVLPNTQWGLHRDPDHRFVAFSLFDAKKMTSSKVLYVADTFETSIHIYGTQRSSDTLSELSVEILTNILNDLDEYDADGDQEA